MTPFLLDPQAHVSAHIARRTRELIGQVRVWSVDGQDIRERRDMLAAGRRFPRPRLVRGTVGRHRLESWPRKAGRPLANARPEAG